MRTGSLPGHFGTFLLVPQHHLLDSIGSPAGGWPLRSYAAHHFWVDSPTLWNQAHYLCCPGPRDLGSRLGSATFDKIGKSESET